MNRDERQKAIASAVAEASQNRLLPASIRVGLAAMGEELREQRAFNDVQARAYDTLREKIDNVILGIRYSKSEKVQTIEEDEANAKETAGRAD